MKFFKHFCDAHRGKSMQAILDRMGHRGHSVWWILVELCAEKLEKKRDEECSEEHCRFTFNARFLRRELHVSSANAEHLLHEFAAFALLSFTKVGDEFNIEFPKLLEYLDRDARRARPVRGHGAPKNKNKKKIKNKEEEREIALALPPLAILWNECCGDLPKVEKTNRARNRKAKDRWPENSPEMWAAIIRRIAGSRFCNGKSDRGWIATFDWLLQPDTHLKVSEGKYDNRGDVAKQKSTEEIVQEVFDGVSGDGIGSDQSA